MSESTAIASHTEVDVADLGNTALLHPMEGLSVEATRDFYIGKSFFHSNWVIAPATTTARAGLGPYFNARACGGCHLGNGRGVLPADDHIESPGVLVVRLSSRETDEHGTPKQEPTYGSELSAFAIPPVAAEGKIVVIYTPVKGRYADGETFTLRQPHIALSQLGYGPLADGARIEPRFAPPIAGVGLLAIIDEADIEAEAARQASDPGSVKGKLNRVWNPLTSRIELGRFGWKANVGDLTQQTVSAFSADIGITSSFAPFPNCTLKQVDCLTAVAGKQPEIDDVTLGRVIQYVTLLAAPPRSSMTVGAVRGEKAFHRFGCEDCHKPEYRAGAHLPPISSELAASRYPPSLAGEPIRAYSDLLLHDMGEGLAGSRPEFLASEREWRTPPLWGIGLTLRIAASEAYLHDGRARSLAEAILWHGGEGYSAREAFRHAPAPDRDALIDFLRSL